MTNKKKVELFIKEYMVALMFTENDDNFPGEFYPENCSMELSQELIDQCRNDCINFCNSMVTFGFFNWDDASEKEITKAAHNFWYSRNGHGVGFWEDDLEGLQELAESFGEFHVYQGDDQLWYGDGN